MDDMMKINLLIDCQRYPLKIRREDEQLYRDAAKKIDEILNNYRKQWPELSPNQYWAMTALDLAYKLRSMEGRNDTKPYLEKLEELGKELDRYVSKE